MGVGDFVQFLIQKMGCNGAIDTVQLWDAYTEWNERINLQIAEIYKRRVQ